ncbi:MAG: ion channel [Planctomycetota bacterium]
MPPPHQPTFDWRAAVAGKYFVLLASLLLLGALYPLIDLGDVGHRTWLIAFWLVLLGGQQAILGHRIVLRVVRGVAIVALVTSLASLIFFDSASITTAVAAANLVFLVVTTTTLLLDVFTGPRVDFDRIVGAICVYLLIGMTFAFLYYLLASFGPPPLRTIIGPEAPRLATCLYFSFVSLTTLGYGDVVPQTAFARLFGSVEAVVGQVYLTVLVARLVGMHLAQRHPAP